MEMIETVNTCNEVCIKKKTTQPSTQKYKQKENAQLTGLLRTVETLATQESTGIAMNPTAKGLSTKRIQQFSKGLI